MSPFETCRIFGDASFGATVGQLGVQAVGVAVIFVLVLALSLATFAAIKATIGLRVSEEEEHAGLDILEHGSHGYGEGFGGIAFGDAPIAADSGRVGDVDGEKEAEPTSV